MLVGYIAPGQSGVNGSLNIKAYIDKEKIAISDTYDESESDNMGTTNNWVAGRTVFTTNEWNSLSTSGSSLSFKIRVEANEGVWVDPYTTPNLMNYINFNRNAANVKEIRFIEETPLRMQRRYDASPGSESNGTKLEQTYQDTGKVLAWIEPITVSPTGTNNELLNVKPKFLFNEEQEENNIEQIDNETSYILYIASSGKTKWVTGYNLFGGFTNVEKISFENVDSSDVTTMSGMFVNLSNLKSIEGLNRFDTSKVENTSAMFMNNSSLTSIDLSGLGSDVLATIGNMFSGCTSLTNINMKNFNFGKINSFKSYDTSSIFYSLKNILETINLSGANFSGSNISNSSLMEMFHDFIELENIDLSNANTSKVTNMDNMFEGCTNLISVIGFNTLDTSKVTDMGNMFNHCSSLVSINMDNQGGNNLSDVHYMFTDCTSLKSISMRNFNFGIASISDNDSPFQSISSVEKIDLSNSIMNNVRNKYLTGLFGGCSSLKEVLLINIDVSSITDMRAMFSGCTSLTAVDLSSFNTSSVTSMSNMFNGCSSLTSLDLSGLGGSNLTSVSGIFNGCTSLTSINMTNFNFGAITNLSKSNSPFYNQYNNRFGNLETIILHGANMSNVTTLNNMFGIGDGYFAKIKKIDFSNVNTSSVEDMSYMFSASRKLENLNLSGMNTSNVTNMSNMFLDTESLEIIDLSSFDTSNVTDMSFMFYPPIGVTVLKTIYVGNNWSISSITDSGNMFGDCTSLVGGNGTVFDSTKIDATMAVIDTPSTPGYLTLAS